MVKIPFYRATLCVSAALALGRCPSVTFVYCMEMDKDITKLFFLPGSSIILVS